MSFQKQKTPPGYGKRLTSTIAVQKQRLLPFPGGVGPGYAPGWGDQTIAKARPVVKNDGRVQTESSRHGGRALVFVDGFSLAYGLNSLGWNEFGWLDIPALARTWLAPEQTLAGVHYFTARLRGNTRDTSARDQQNRYLDAIATQPEVHVHYGHFLERQVRCPVCGETSRRFEEKMTDVHIAVQMLHAARTDAFDVGFLVSADSDLTPPVRLIRSTFPTKRIMVILPPGRHSVELQKVAHGTFHIQKQRLRRCQLSNPVLRADGYPIWRSPDEQTAASTIPTEAKEPETSV